MAQGGGGVFVWFLCHKKGIFMLHLHEISVVQFYLDWIDSGKGLPELCWVYTVSGTTPAWSVSKLDHKCIYLVLDKGASIEWISQVYWLHQQFPNWLVLFPI